MVSRTALVISLWTFLGIVFAEDDIREDILISFRDLEKVLTIEQIEALVEKNLPEIEKIFNHQITKDPTEDIKSNQLSFSMSTQKDKPKLYKENPYNHVLVSSDSPADLRSKFSQAQQKSILQAEHALITEKIAKILLKNGLHSKLDGLNKINITGTSIQIKCQAPKTDTFQFVDDDDSTISDCLTSKYRTFDGYCNNPVDKMWGRSFTKFQRFLNQTAYADEISAPRSKSVLGSNLPPVRKISSNVIISQTIEGSHDDHPVWSHYFPDFGQFLDHDLTNTPQFRAFNEHSSPKCCEVSNPLEECFTIDTSEDPLFQKFNKSCMEFVRSLAADNTGCKFGPREQLNQATAFIDGSQIYGNDEHTAQSLMNPLTGKLKKSCISSGHLLPKRGRPRIPSSACAAATEITGRCDFVAGDDRSNMVPALVAMHTVFLRHHNNLVDKLKEQGWVNPDELYQEARRIIGAQLQFITYNEFLPIVFLHTLDQFKDLDIKNPIKYDIKVHPSMYNEFATAAYRFGHSMIKGLITLSDINLKPSEIKPEALSDHFFHPYDIYKCDQLNKYIRAGIVDHAQDTNNIMTDQLTNFLFKTPHSMEPGLDLASLNLQRGRDHGIPSYIHYRKHCNLSVPKRFNDLKEIMYPSCVKKLKITYRNVADIDLWIGGMCENISSFGAVGPTFGCIIAQQFINLRQGDRFFFNNKIPFNVGMDAISFSKEQIEEIKKTKLSHILCSTGDIKEIHSEAMLFVGNATPCDKILKDEMNMAVFSPPTSRNPRIFKSKANTMKELVNRLLS